MVAQVVYNTNIKNPIFVQAVVHSKNGVLQIRSLTKDDVLCKKVVQFLENNAFEFYRNGTAYKHKEAVETVNMLRNRLESGNPFSGFAVLDGENVVGLVRVGFDDDPRKIQIAGMGLDTYQKQGTGREVLNWILKDYLPALHAKGYRLPVFGDDGKQIKEWVNLNKTSVVATVHPDYPHCNELLSKGGFGLVKQVHQEKFSGVHDGRRNIYEIALDRFIRSPETRP